jgi:alpha-mannosidase
VKRIHLVCNAHIDPVWLWEWPEGAGEALSTFRTAAGFCETHDGFVFCHNEALLYQWIEEYEPRLFERIRVLVRANQWNILGGWFLQPDCNMPSGESFIRQVLLGKLYFRDKFGVDVKTAANLDPFGHTRGLVQILARSGYTSYLFCRPDHKNAPLPAAAFIWTGYDGSEVLAARAEAHYNSSGGGARAKVEAWVAAHPDRPLSILLWGIGDHGGGASRQDLASLKALIESETGFEIRHSTAEAYFADLAAEKDHLPRHNRDLNPWAPGCYTTMARVKHGHRRLENELLSAEKMASAASFQGLMKYPAAELAEAVRDLAFSEFHDILPGSSIGPGEEGAVRLIGHGLEILSRVKTKAFFALAAGEPPAGEGEIPILVHNPHPFPVRGQVECEFEDHEPNCTGGYLLPRVFKKNKALPSQPEHELSHLSIEWRKKVVFEAELEPGRMNRFTCRLERIEARPAFELRETDGAFRFKTKDLEVRINAATGLIDLYRAKGVACLGPGAGRALVIRDNADPWGMNVRGFRDVVGAFELMDAETGTGFSGVSAAVLPSVRVVEDGPVRTIIESLFASGRSQIVQRVKLPKRGTEIEIEIRAFWNEKDRMLKLAFPVPFAGPKFLGQVACGVGELPANGDEAVSQKWLAVVSEAENSALTVINDGTYGSDFTGGELRLSLLRSPAHAADPGGAHIPPAQDRFVPRIDQGERVLRFWINGGPLPERLTAIDREALAKNEAPMVLPYFPPGTGKRARPFIVLSDDAVQVMALKRAERTKDLIIRLFEPTGAPRTTELALPALRAKTEVALGAFEIKTLRFSKKTKAFESVDLLEDPV